ncbi:integration host factor subunit alpha [Paraburkholderia sp. BR14263]|uniref:integration host factor subunit alpha n=1 Tax=unclassified Paraburkholderia TaxID=2615204 RepID=UPI0034CE7A38
MKRDWPVMRTADAARTRTFRKADLIAALCDRAGLSREEATEMIEAFFETLRATLVAGETVKLAGFGVFALRDKPPRPGRNPQTGVAAPITARRIVKFRASAQLQARVERDEE